MEPQGVNPPTITPDVPGTADTETTVIETPKKKSTGMLMMAGILGSVILLVLGFLGGKYWANQPQVIPPEELPSPTPAVTLIDITSWLSFNHKSYSIKHPSTVKVIPMKGPSGDTTPAEDFPDILLSTQEGFDQPHLRVLRFASTFADVKLPLMDLATKYYQENLNMPAAPATSVQMPTEAVFDTVPAVYFRVENKAFKTPSDEYLGYEGTYRAVFFKSGEVVYLVYWTETPEMDRMSSTFTLTPTGAATQ